MSTTPETTTREPLSVKLRDGTKMVFLPVPDRDHPPMWKHGKIVLFNSDGQWWANVEGVKPVRREGYHFDSAVQELFDEAAAHVETLRAFGLLPAAPTLEDRWATVEELVEAADVIGECATLVMEAVYLNPDQQQERREMLDESRAEFRALAEKAMGVMP
jgi:hypothetical protein